MAAGVVEVEVEVAVAWEMREAPDECNSVNAPLDSTQNVRRWKRIAVVVVVVVVISFPVQCCFCCCCCFGLVGSHNFISFSLRKIDL